MNVRPGTVRIVGGSRRGRRLRVARQGEVRPTADRVREAIFDVLGPLHGLLVLDLFAGSGAMGLEALSRGAARCIFVESDKQVAGVLRANIEMLAYPEVSTQVLSVDYQSAVARLAEGREEERPGSRFDLLFVDPPYRMLQEVEVMLAPVLPALLASEGLVVVEGPRTVQVDMGLTPFFDRIYGETRVVMLERRRDSP